MISPAFLQELLGRVDIVAVVDRHVPLKRAGANYVARCPFHVEKTPSFTVSSAKQFYHCFGCGAHGDAIRFLMEYSGANFVESVRELAAGVGLSVPEESHPAHADIPASRKAAADIFAVLRQAADYYRSRLKKADDAIGYLKDRGVSGEIAARFGIGYAPGGWQNLKSIFPEYNAPVLTEAGLLIEGTNGGRYDRFRERIMFPILNREGTVVGFGGRILGSGEPKYLNSPETPVFSKGRELYGLYQARRAIREAGRALVVEGYMDVLALAQHGVEYAIATLGTATTETHVQTLFRLTDEVIFCFDGDEAGRKAAWRALENSLGLITDSKRVGFLFLPPGEDPDTYVRKAAAEDRWETVPLSTFLLDALAAKTDLSSEEGRARLLAEAKPLLNKITAPVLGLILRKRLAELAGLAHRELNELFPSNTVRSAIRVPRSRRSAPVSLCRKLIRVLLHHPEAALQVDKALLAQAGAEGEAVASLVDFVANQVPLPAPNVLVPLALTHFRDTPHQPLLQEEAAAVLSWEADFDGTAELQGILDRLREARARKRFDQLRAKSLAELTGPERDEMQQLLTLLAGPKPTAPTPPPSHLQ